MLTAYDANLDLKAARKSQEISGYYYRFALHIGNVIGFLAIAGLKKKGLPNLVKLIICNYI